MQNSPNVYGSVYSGVPVYEFMCRGIAVMRRKNDNFLNATQILKVAQIEKGKRTKILEREIQIPGAIFEKVQGGYGKYQGTWVPFERGVEVARQFGVEDILSDILEFQPSNGPSDRALFEVTPSKKRKLSNASSTAPTVDLKSQPQIRASSQSQSSSSQQLYVEQAQIQRQSQNIPSNNEKYRAILMSVFLNHDSQKIPPLLTNSLPPPDLDPNMIIDDQGHTALHWASALARINILKMLIGNLGADVSSVNYNGESALIRAVLVTNCFESDCFADLLAALGNSVIGIRDNKGRTVLHHIVLTSGIKGRAQASRYYLETLIQFMREPSHFQFNESGSQPVQIQVFIESLINVQDKNGDTALNIASRLGNKALVETLIDSCGADVAIPNRCGLRPVDFGLEDALLRPVFEKKINPQQSLQDVSNPTDIPAFATVMPSGFSSQSSLLTDTSGRLKSRQLSQEFEGVVSSLEHNLEEKDKKFQDAVSQVQILSNELAQSRSLIAKLSSKLLEQGCDLSAIKNVNSDEERKLTKEQLLEKRLGQMTAILKAHGLQITPQMLDASSLNQSEKQSPSDDLMRTFDQHLSNVLSMDFQNY